MNATQNRYTQQTYAVSPYIQGVFGTSGISYQLRDDNLWTFASNFGDFTTSVPGTYANHLKASINSPTHPWGWSLTYDRAYYENGVTGSANVANTTYMTQVARLIVPYQIDPQVQIAPRIGYEDTKFPLTGTRDVVYGVGGQWSPSDRTQVVGFWEHRFFGSSYSAQIQHRLPNVALSANFARGLTSYPQNALSIPAGANVAQFLDSAFATRIPDPNERSLAIEQFLAKTGLPATLASPVDFYSPSITLQESVTASVALIGVRNTITFSVFYLKSDAISGTGAVLPPALQFGQNNTQTGGGVSLSHSLTGLTNLTASASYNRTTANTTEGPLSSARTNNAYANINLNTQFGPKTSGTAGVGYSWSGFPGSLISEDTSAWNIFAGINHTF